MGRKTARDRLKDESGQNLVEFALTVPILLLIVLGIAEFGRAWMTKNILTGAAREAVRIAVVSNNGNVIDTAPAVTRATEVLSSAGITTAIVTVSDGGSFGSVTATVTYNFPTVVAGFIPGLDNATIRLDSTTTMRREF